MYNMKGNLSKNKIDCKGNFVIYYDKIRLS